MQRPHVIKWVRRLIMTFDIMPWIVDIKLIFLVMRLVRSLFALLGYCFVDFANHSDAENALIATDGQVLRENILRVKWGTRNKRLFLSGLEKTINWEREVLPLFSAHGPLDTEQCRQIPNKYMVCGIVAFLNRNEAERAKTSLSGVSIGLKEMSVKWEQSCGNDIICSSTKEQEGGTGDATTIASSNKQDFLSSSSEMDSSADNTCSVITSSNEGRGVEGRGLCKSSSRTYMYTKHPHYSVHISFRSVQVRNASV